MHYCLAQDLPTLVWAANLADIELHTSLSRKNDVARPTMMVFDLDPGAPADIVQCCQVGLWLRDIVGRHETEELGQNFRLERSANLRPAEHAVPTTRQRSYRTPLPSIWSASIPELVVSNMSKALRKGKIFVDWSQNDEHKTTICVYSLRAKEQPTVSTPVTWEEVEVTVKKKNGKRLVFRCDQTLARVEKMGDLFEQVATLKQKLPRKWQL